MNKNTSIFDLIVQGLSISQLALHALIDSSLLDRNLEALNHADQKLSVELHPFGPDLLVTKITPIGEIESIELFCRVLSFQNPSCALFAYKDRYLLHLSSDDTYTPLRGFEMYVDGIEVHSVSNERSLALCTLHYERSSGHAGYTLTMRVGSKEILEKRLGTQGSIELMNRDGSRQTIPYPFLVQRKVLLQHETQNKTKEKTAELVESY